MTIKTPLASLHGTNSPGISPRHYAQPPASLCLANQLISSGHRTHSARPCASHGITHLHPAHRIHVSPALELEGREDLIDPIKVVLAKLDLRALGILSHSLRIRRAGNWDVLPEYISSSLFSH